MEMIEAFAEVIKETDPEILTGYNKLGFEWVHRSSPNYWWVINGVRHHRFNWNKKKSTNE